MSRRKPPTLLTYLKAAFANRWNLLAFLGAMGFALISGAGDVLMPLVLAGEVLYVGALATHPKFQRYVDARQSRGGPEDDSVRTAAALKAIVGRLPAEFMHRFEALRDRCLELRQIAMELKDPGRTGDGPRPLEELQSAGLDRLLWIYLRLLFTEYSLQRFLARTNPDTITADITELEQSLAKSESITDPVQRQKVQYTLQDNLQTCRNRLANLEKARDNLQVVRLEIDRLENKIRALSEMAVNRQEPDFISAQVDEVANSMLETEKTMNELQFATGLEPTYDTAPALLRRPVVGTQNT